MYVCNSSGALKEQSQFDTSDLQMLVLGEDLRGVLAQTQVIIYCAENLTEISNLVQGTSSSFPPTSACISVGTNYIDLLVDPVHVSNMISTFDAAARENSVKVLPGCGAIEVC
jgi:short subunit dehydrogenase-like uncharacterized protein